MMMVFSKSSFNALPSVQMFQGGLHMHGTNIMVNSEVPPVEGAVDDSSNYR
jgi:hypothetical protein